MRTQSQMGEQFVVALVHPARPQGRGAVVKELVAHMRDRVVLRPHFDPKFAHGVQMRLSVFAERLRSGRLACATSALLYDVVHPCQRVRARGQGLRQCLRQTSGHLPFILVLYRAQKKGPCSVWYSLQLG